ncbi:MAG: rhomboid family intramembrane serine protease, partial [Fervidobacterium sp.]
MFPLYDTIPSIRKPYINVTIIIVNVIVFLYELAISGMDWSGRILEGFFYTYGFVPEKMFYAFPFVAMITHMFIH